MLPFRILFVPWALLGTKMTPRPPKTPLLGSFKFYNVIFLVGHFGFFLLSGEESVLADFYDLKSICQGYRRSPGDIRRKKLKNILRVDFEKKGNKQETKTDNLGVGVCALFP